MVKNIDGLGDKTISALTYNELGQVQNKTLGNNLSVQDYSYNIRGWLNGINKAFVETNGGTNPYFGEVLNYDFGFGTKQYNGNIAGAKWKAAKRMKLNNTNKIPKPKYHLRFSWS